MIITSIIMIALFIVIYKDKLRGEENEYKRS